MHVVLVFWENTSTDYVCVWPTHQPTNVQLSGLRWKAANWHYCQPYSQGLCYHNG